MPVLSTGRLLFRVVHALVAAVLAVSIQAVASAAPATWGYNYYGQLGDGTNTNRTLPVQVAGLPEITQIACEHYHTLALGADGTVWTWGGNGHGQLGDGSVADRWAPGQVVGLTGCIAVGGGDWHSLALKADGTVWAWGRNETGQLGDGTTVGRRTPVKVTGLSDVVAIASGAWHSLALTADGAVWAWGGSFGGAIGDGTNTNRLVPVRVQGLTGIIAISGTGHHGLAVRSDGTLWAWGANTYGQIGDGTTQDRYSPVRVLLPSGVIAVSGGALHNMALLSDGSVWTWGRNHDGQLGDGTSTDRWIPVQVQGLPSCTAVAAGDVHSMALGADTIVRSWGLNSSGQLGTGGTASSSVPVPVAGSTGTGAVDAGYLHSGSLPAPPQPSPTTLYTVDRTGTITEPIRMRAYLRRVSDLAWLAGRVVMMNVDGSHVGSAVTNPSGMAYLDWAIAPGTATRSIAATHLGDAYYAASSASATLTALTQDTTLTVPSRSGEIGDSVLLKAYLYWGPMHLPAQGKVLTFAVDGTVVGSAATNPNGRSLLTHVPLEGEGPGARSLTVQWLGDGGYRAASTTATLGVDQAPSYLWLASRSAQRGANTYLRAYLRRLPDYSWLTNRTIRFSVDGAVLGAAVTDSGGRASYLFAVTAETALGDHPMVAAFDGDPWYMPHGSAGVLTVTP